jgi:hypothetical protein
MLCERTASRTHFHHLGDGLCLQYRFDIQTDLSVIQKVLPKGFF